MASCRSCGVGRIFRSRFVPSSADLHSTDWAGARGLQPSFQNLVIQKLWIQVDILSAYRDFEVEIDSLIHTLEAEIGR